MTPCMRLCPQVRRERCAGPGGMWDLVAVLWPEPRHQEAPMTGQYQLGYHSSSAQLEDMIMHLRPPPMICGQLPAL